jgi:hypothetical protein
MNEEINKEFMQALREYYDAHDTSEEMNDGHWVYPFPEQLELDLDVTQTPWDEDTICTEVDMKFFFDYELTNKDWDELTDRILEIVDERWPNSLMCGNIRRGTDRELFPEDYNESEETDGTEEKEV